MLPGEESVTCKTSPSLAFRFTALATSFWFSRSRSEGWLDELLPRLYLNSSASIRNLVSHSCLTGGYFYPAVPQSPQTECLKISFISFILSGLSPVWQVSCQAGNRVFILYSPIALPWTYTTEGQWSYCGEFPITSILSYWHQSTPGPCHLLGLLWSSSCPTLTPSLLTSASSLILLQYSFDSVTLLLHASSPSCFLLDKI